MGFGWLIDQGWLLLWVAVDGWDGWWVVVAGLWVQSVAEMVCGLLWWMCCGLWWWWERRVEDRQRFERLNLSTQNTAPTRGKLRRSVEEESRVEVALALEQSVDTIFLAMSYLLCLYTIVLGFRLKFVALLDALASCCGIGERQIAGTRSY